MPRSYRWKCWPNTINTHKFLRILWPTNRRDKRVLSEYHSVAVTIEEQMLQSHPTLTAKCWEGDKKPDEKIKWWREIDNLDDGWYSR